MVNGFTTIQISDETREGIEKLKDYPKQTAELVVSGLVKIAVENMPKEEVKK